MKVNVLSGALWEVNTTDGNKDLGFHEISYLTDYDESRTVGLEAPDVLVMDFDLGRRIHIDKIEYKYDTPYTSGQPVTSGITFYYKEESYDNYVALTAYADTDDLFYATTSGVFTPRYLRLKHDISATQGVTVFSGTAYGIKAYNNEGVVNFGEDGTKTDETIEVVREAAADIRAVAIYNSGTDKADAYVNLEPSHNDIDYAISISANEDGPWTYPLDDDLIADSDTFELGSMEDVTAGETYLRIDGIELGESFASTKEVGTYTTRVFDISENNYSKLCLGMQDSGGSLKTAVTDPNNTVEIRHSNNIPKPYMVVREIMDAEESSGAVVYHYARYKDSWLETGALKENGSFVFLEGHRYSRYTKTGVYFESNTERYSGFASNDYDDARSVAHLYLYSINNGTVLYRVLATQTADATAVNFVWEELQHEVAGGFWVYFFCQAYNTSDYVDNRGYYLCHFDSALDSTFKYYLQSDFVADMTTNYNTTHVWYTDSQAHAIYKIAPDGTIEVNYSNEDYTSDLGGILVMPDNNIMFANDKSLHTLSQYGEIVSGGSIEDVAYDKFSQIELDGDGSEAIWVLDGSYIARLFVSGERKGTYDFRLQVDLPQRFEALEAGVWLECLAGETETLRIFKYISKSNRRIDYTYEAENGSRAALIYQDYNNPYYIAKMPIATDSTWSNLSWNKVPLDNYLLSADAYCQMRLTLRTESPIELYPEFITDPDQDFFYNDDFSGQESSTPKQLLWGNWLNKPAVTSVYIDTINDNAVLVPSINDYADVFLSTTDRVIYGRTTAPELDVQLTYMISDGDNDVETGLTESITIYIKGVEAGYTDRWAAVQIYVPQDPSVSYSKVGVMDSEDTTWYYTNLGQSGTQYYEGILRLYWGTDGYLKASVSTDGGSNWSTSANLSLSEAFIGNFFHIELQVYGHGSTTKFSNFNVNECNAYYYSRTPKIYSINKQDLVEIKDVYPDNYKNVYVRTYVDKNAELLSGYNIDMTTRWRISVQ